MPKLNDNIIRTIESKKNHKKMLKEIDELRQSFNSIKADRQNIRIQLMKSNKKIQDLEKIIETYKDEIKMIH
jgi:septal ring factor EnvC (AmiA/AmiB activator)